MTEMKLSMCTSRSPTWWYKYSFTGTEYRWLVSFMLRLPYFLGENPLCSLNSNLCCTPFPVLEIYENKFLSK